MRFSLITLLASLLGASVASAHVEPGFYFGRTPQGQACFMQAIETYFENKTPHPLNERVRLIVGKDEFIVRHPPVIEADKNVVFFNHDQFQGVLPTPTGARALIVHMRHEGGKEGPAAFHAIENVWKTGVKTALICNGLVRK